MYTQYNNTTNIYKIMGSRLETLRNRYERLVDANSLHGFVRSEKADRYVRTVRAIKSQITSIEAENREADRSISDFLNTTKGMSGFQIIMNSKKHQS